MRQAQEAEHQVDGGNPTLAPIARMVRAKLSDPNVNRNTWASNERPCTMRYRKSTRLLTHWPRPVRLENTQLRKLIRVNLGCTTILEWRRLHAFNNPCHQILHSS